LNLHYSTGGGVWQIVLGGLGGGEMGENGSDLRLIIIWPAVLRFLRLFVRFWHKMIDTGIDFGIMMVLSFLLMEGDMLELAFFTSFGWICHSNR
jgi:hypothetical protein